MPTPCSPPLLVDPPCHLSVQVVRRLFERVTALRLSSKKMKFFFKRYLVYARAAADDELVEHVKEKARAWVESAAAQE